MEGILILILTVGIISLSAWLIGIIRTTYHNTLSINEKIERIEQILQEKNFK